MNFNWINSAVPEDKRSLLEKTASYKESTLIAWKLLIEFKKWNVCLLDTKREYAVFLRVYDRWLSSEEKDALSKDYTEN